MALFPEKGDRSIDLQANSFLGYLTRADWRWCFGINLPIAVLALLVIFFILRKELLGPQPIPELNETTVTGKRSRFAARLKTIDFGGQLLFILGFGLIILGLTWAGATYSWSSAAVLVSLILGVFLVCGFFVWERQLSPGRSLSRVMPHQRAMIPWSLLTNRDIGLLFYTECATGMSMFAVGHHISNRYLHFSYLDPADNMYQRCFTFATFTSLPSRQAHSIPLI